jgi:hypothetical protein
MKPNSNDIFESGTGTPANGMLGPVPPASMNES